MTAHSLEHETTNGSGGRRRKSIDLKSISNVRVLILLFSRFFFYLSYH
jgi:hypothetical protein